MHNKDMATVGIVGYGNMGRAFALGLGAKLGKDKLVVYDIDGKKAEGAKEDGIPVASDIHFLVDSSDFILIAVKPKDVPILLKSLGDIGNRILVSIAAGVRIASIEDIVGKKKIIRCMPNINVLVSRGSIAYSPNTKVSEDDIKTFEGIFSSCGTLYSIKESMMDSFTAIAGSSPAYILEFIDALALAGVREGFSYEESLRIVLDTISGTAELLKELKGNPNEWITKITSPAGTTIEGVKKLEEKGFRGTVMECIESTTRKAKELGSK